MTRQQILAQQEAMLTFAHFTNSDGVRLGSFLARKLEQEGLHATVAVRRCGGFTLFQSGPDGTQQLNAIWMDKKLGTVQIFGKSSLLAGLDAQMTGQTMADHGLQDSCAFAPGGFPIAVTGTGMVGAVALSGLPDLEDHNVLVRLLADYLQIKDMPTLEKSE